MDRSQEYRNPFKHLIGNSRILKIPKMEVLYHTVPYKAILYRDIPLHRPYIRQGLITADPHHCLCLAFAPAHGARSQVGRQPEAPPRDHTGPIKGKPGKDWKSIKVHGCFSSEPLSHWATDWNIESIAVRTWVKGYGSIVICLCPVLDAVLGDWPMRCFSKVGQVLVVLVLYVWSVHQKLGCLSQHV